MDNNVKNGCNKQHHISLNNICICDYAKCVRFVEECEVKVVLIMIIITSFSKRCDIVYLAKWDVMCSNTNTTAKKTESHSSQDYAKANNKILFMLLKLCGFSWFCWSHYLCISV